MKSQAAMLVAFLSGNAAVGEPAIIEVVVRSGRSGAPAPYPQQVQALDEIYTQAEGKNHTLMLWRMYQTLHAAAQQSRSCCRSSS